MAITTWMNPGGTLSCEDLGSWLSVAFGGGDASAPSGTQGVFMHPKGGPLNRFAGSGTTSPVTIGTGWAMVGNKIVCNDAPVSVTVSTPAAAARKDRIVLRHTYATGATEVCLIQSAEGATDYADYTTSAYQTAGTVWTIPLDKVDITTGGAITLTDERDPLLGSFGGSVPLGTIIMWSGTMSGHYPVVGGLTDTRWHLCNGETVAGLATPDLRDRFVVGASDSYSIGNTGGAVYVNLQHAHTNANESAHTHASGSIATANESSHTHTQGNTGSESSHTHTQGNTGSGTPHRHDTYNITDTATGFVLTGGEWGGSPSHVDKTSQETAHTHTNPTTSAGSAHSHTNPTTSAGSAHNHSVSGTTAAGSAHTHTMNNQLSATQDIRPPYYALAYLMRVA